MRKNFLVAFPSQNFSDKKLKVMSEETANKIDKTRADIYTNEILILSRLVLIFL